MKPEEIKELISLLEKGSLKKIVIKKGDFEIQLEKDGSSNSCVEKTRHDTLHEKVKYPPESPPPKAGNYVSSPMVGTFYAAPSANQPTFVKLGDKVSEDTVVCIIEAMKVMNEVKAGQKGEVAEILVDNTQPVEFGTKLFRII